MSDHDEDLDVDLSTMAQRWDQFEDDFLLFDRIPPPERPFSSSDLCAWALLDKKFPSARGLDMVSGAGHDQVWLRITRTEIAQLTDEEILYLVRCGVMFESDTETLSMFV